MNYIEVSHVSKAFGQKKVLKDISFTIKEGEIFGLLGPSGAGKTTLIRILTGQLSYSGNARIMGKRCDRLDRSIYADIGMVLDNSGIYERLSCRDNMLLFARLHKMPRGSVPAILNRVGLTDINASAGKLSKGMKQRLVLARALLHHPKIFGVPKELCRKYNKENRITILCRDGRNFTFPNKPDSADSIRAFFADDNIETIHSSEPDLETVFMSLTGKELDR